MELKKCCNHSFLIKQPEDGETETYEEQLQVGLISAPSYAAGYLGWYGQLFQHRIEHFGILQFNLYILGCRKRQRETGVVGQAADQA